MTSKVPQRAEGDGLSLDVPVFLFVELDKVPLVLKIAVSNNL